MNLFRVCASTQGDVVVSADSLGNLTVFDAADVLQNTNRSGSCAWTAHAGAVYDAAFWQERRVVSCGDDGRMAMWSIDHDNMGEQVAQHCPSKAEINGIVCDAASGCVWGASGDGHLVEWNVEQSAASVRLAHQGGVLCIARAAQSQQIVTGGADGTVKVWDLRQDGGPAQTLCVAVDTEVLAVAVSDDEKWIAAGSDACVACLWHTSSPQLVSALPHAASVSAVLFASPRDGGGLVTGDLGSSKLYHWSLDGTLRMQVATKNPSTYSILINQPARFRMLLAAGSSHSVDVYLGDFTKRAFGIAALTSNLH